MTLRLKLLVLLVLPLTAVFVVIGWTQFDAMRDLALAAAKERALLLTQATAREIDGDLARAMHVAHAGSAALTHAPELKGERVWSLLEELVRRVPLVEGASIAWNPDEVDGDEPAAPYVWQRDGVMHRRDLKEEYEREGQPNYTQSSWYRVADDGKGGWTAPYDGPVFGGLLVSYSVPVLRAGAVVAVVSLDVPLLPLQERLSIGEFTHTLGYLVGPDDRFISNPNPDNITKPVAKGGAPTALAKTQPATLIREPAWPDGKPHIIAVEPIPTTDWVFAAAMSEHEVLGPVRWQLARNVAVLVIGGLIMAAIVLTTGLRLTGDVRRLGAAVGRVSSGELGATVERIRRRDELGTLAVDFNTMTRRLEATVHEVAAAEAAKQRVDQELEVAREIQEQMLPHDDPVLPDYPEVDLFAVNVAARHVAGDFYDYWVRDGVLTVVLADVAGSGMPAALVMVRAMTLLRQFDDPDVPLVDVVSRTNVELCDDNERQVFVTGVIARYHLAEGTFEIVSAGHLPALVCAAGSVREEGDSTGPLLGVVADGVWASRRGALAPGDWLAFYTDGITEARNASGDMLGTEGLAAGLCERPQEVAQTVAAQGIEIAERWHGGHVDDDLSMLVLRRT